MEETLREALTHILAVIAVPLIGQDQLYRNLERMGQLAAIETIAKEALDAR